mgnify:CR=1 FL=1|jgi:hypothetical protein
MEIIIISMPRRSYEISNACLIAVTFIIMFSITKIVMQVREKYQHKNSKKEIKIHNPRGGSNEIKFSDDNELSFAILSCIGNNENYLVKSAQIKKLIFSLVKEKLKTNL